MSVFYVALFCWYFVALHKAKKFMQKTSTHCEGLSCTTVWGYGSILATADQFSFFSLLLFSHKRSRSADMLTSACVDDRPSFERLQWVGLQTRLSIARLLDYTTRTQHNSIQHNSTQELPAVSLAVLWFSNDHQISAIRRYIVMVKLFIVTNIENLTLISSSWADSCRDRYSISKNMHDA